MILQQWSIEAEQGLLVSAGADLVVIKSEVESGISELYKLGNDGYCVVRFESEFNEAVLVLGEGRNFSRWLPVIENWARRLGAKTFRTHITSRGLQKMYERIGFKQREIVMSKTL